MNGIVLVFDGKDLTIEKEKLEAIGLREGDKVEVRPSKPVLVPANFSEEEILKRQAILDEHWGLWSEEDEKAYREIREEMNRSWQPRDIS